MATKKPTFPEALEAFDQALRDEVKETPKDPDVGGYIGTLRNIQQLVVRLQAQHDQMTINKKLKEAQNA